jgi:hypothetical protein
MLAKHHRCCSCASNALRAGQNLSTKEALRAIRRASLFGAYPAHTPWLELAEPDGLARARVADQCRKARLTQLNTSHGLARHAIGLKSRSRDGRPEHGRRRTGDCAPSGVQATSVSLAAVRDGAALVSSTQSVSPRIPRSGSCRQRSPRAPSALLCWSSCKGSRPIRGNR